MNSREFNIRQSLRSSLSFSIYLFIIATILAYFEVQVEGPNGWAGLLPTWKTIDPRITWIFGGRPVTGYHVSLNILLMSFFHWPLLFNKWSIVFEAKTLSVFALLATIWDFLWFVINPNFGLSRYNSDNIWWFTHWFLGIPVDYYLGLLMAIIIRCIPAVFKKEPFIMAFSEGIFFVLFTLSITALFTIVCNMIINQ
jgi:hypothetical protein